jgi:hypothetical protein
MIPINFADDKEIKKIVDSIIYKYCRKYPNSGRPIFCTPSFEEQVRMDTLRYKKKKKYIYDSEEIALKCADELTRTAGWTRQKAYPCPRSKHGHYHLTRRQM